jgi:hypothetical protein
MPLHIDAEYPVRATSASLAVIPKLAWSVENQWPLRV